MRVRLSPLSAFCAGYVLGAKAGRERYEQIVDLARRIAGTQPAQQLQAEVKHAASKAGARLEEKASEGVAKVSELVHSAEERVGNGAGPGEPSPKLPPA